MFCSLETSISQFKPLCFSLYLIRHEGMMEMADYWLLDKSLVPKLFEQLVPRYADKTGPYTLVHKLSTEYPGSTRKKIVLELKDNGLPAIKTPADRDLPNTLTNVLIRGLKSDYQHSKPKPQSQ